MKLLKAIVHHGIDGPTDERPKLIEVYRRLPTTTHILDERAVVNGIPFNYDGFREIRLPFRSVWIERPCTHGGATDGQVGAYCQEMEGAIRLTLFTAALVRPQFIGYAMLYAGNGGEFRVEDSKYFPARVAAEADLIEKVCSSAYHSILETLEHLMCNNIGLVAHAHEKSVVKRLTKITPQPGYRYHTLVVTGLRTSGGAGRATCTMPLHLCRGHWAEYGPKFGKGLLFGKYAGRFFVPDCNKGDAKNGIVDKDYAVV